MEAFAKFGSDLDKATLHQLNRGQRLVELLKQGQYQPMPVERQIVSLYTGTTGALDEVPIEKVREFEIGLHAYIDARHPDIFAKIRDGKTLTDELKTSMNKAIEEFKVDFARSAA
jgi:F-type H+-transporting ATPase subunit alpha